MTSLFLCVAVLAAACGTKLPLDRGMDMGATVEADIREVPVSGFRVRVHGAANEAGELLAVDERFVWILRESMPVPHPREGITAIDVVGHGRVRPADFDTLFQFARFPQGLPEDPPAAPRIAVAPPEIDAPPSPDAPPLPEVPAPPEASPSDGADALSAPPPPR